VRIRNGFVSNSSSSSFCIYGFEFDKDMVSEEDVKKWAGKDYSKSYRDEEFKYNFYEFIEDKLKSDKLKSTGLNVKNYGESYYIGRSWSSIKDNETGKKFKNSVEKEVKSIFGKNIKSFETYGENYEYGPT
jgi:hypothetical protein